MSTSQCPEVSRAVEYRFGDREDQRLLAEDRKPRQLSRGALLLVAAADFVARHGGERERSLLLRVGQGMLLNDRISQLDHVRENVRIQEHYRHWLLENAGDICTLANGLVQLIDPLVAESV